MTGKMNDQTELKGVIVIEVYTDESSSMNWSNTLTVDEVILNSSEASRIADEMLEDEVKDMEEPMEDPPVVLYLTDNDRQILLDALDNEIDDVKNEERTENRVKALKGIKETIEYYGTLYNPQTKANISEQSDE